MRTSALVEVFVGSFLLVFVTALICRWLDRRT